jgi:dipeptidyl aminopeptidase/acylaminoacyl peptidase
MTRPLSPDTLIYDLAMAGDPQVAPDGSRVLYTLSTTDPDTKKTTSHLWVCAIDGTAPRRLTWSGERNGSARWSPDGRQIAFVSDRVTKSGLFVLPVEGGGEAREVTRHGQPIGDPAWSPDGARVAYTVLYDPANPTDEEPPESAAPRVRVTRRIDYKQDNRGYLNDARTQVFVVDVATGARRQVTTARFDHNYPQWSPDGRWLSSRISYRNGFYSQLALVDLVSGETRRVGPETGVVGLWAWSPQGDRIIFAGDTAHTFQLDFFLYDVAADTVRRLTDDLPSLPDAGFPTILPPAQPVWLDDRRAFFHAVHAGASQLALIDSVTGRVEVVQDWTALHTFLSVDAARRHVVQAYAGLDAVGEIVVFDPASAQTRVITQYNAPLLREHPPARWEQLTVPRGALQIEAWLLLPPDFDPSRRYPLVLDVHGGPHGYYGFGFNVIQQCLATNDFVVVYANPRGSGSYGRHFAQQVVRDWGGEDFDDLMAVVDAVVQRPYVDPARLGIYGYSYGGYMTAWTIGRTDRFQAAVCGAPCFDLESMYGTSDIGHVFCALEYGGAPHEERAWYAAHSPSTFAHQVRTPTLIIHGEADERCPIGQGEQMFVALLKAGCEVEFARYPGGSHLFLRAGPAEHRADVLARILAWFKSHLGNPA